MIEAPSGSDKDSDLAMEPVVRGKRRPKTMRTPGMGAMGGAPRRRGLPSMGEIKQMEYAKGGSVSSRADGCAIRGKTKGKIL